METARKCTRCGGERLGTGHATWCQKCKNDWQRSYRAGVRLQRRVPPPIRTASGCLEWQGYVDPWGYGRVTRGGRALKAHRVAWEDAVGPIPEGLTIDHLCCNKICVETRHMEVVTLNENSRRGGAVRRGLA